MLAAVANEDIASGNDMDIAGISQFHGKAGRQEFKHLLGDGKVSHLDLSFCTGDLGFQKDKSRGEYIEVYRNPEPSTDTWEALAANHLNVYVTSLTTQVSSACG